MMVTIIGAISSSLQSALFNHFHISYLISVSHPSCEICIISHILQMRKMELWTFKYVSQVVQLENDQNKILTFNL